MKRVVFRITVATLALVIVFFAVQRLLTPKYASIAIEGNLIREYYDSTFDHDVIFIGDCEVYANFSPITLWEEHGITSFIRGSPQQLVWHSYYILEDTINRANILPQVVVFNVMSMQYATPQHEPYNRLTLDGMRLSPTKIRAVSSSMMEDESMLSYIFPFFRFKEHWQELGAEDFRYFFVNPRVSINGFMVRADVLPKVMLPTPRRPSTFEFGEKPIYYLNKIVDLTAEHGIELILIKAPNPFPYWFSQWDEQIVSFAAENDLTYINFLDYIEEIGLDFKYHTFNAGGHLNVFGAQLLSSYFGRILSEDFDVGRDRTGTELAQTIAHWEELSKLYNRQIQIQLSEIERYGEIQTLLIGSN